MLRHNDAGERLQPLATGNLGSGAPLWLEWQVYVLKLCGIVAGKYLRFQLGSEFPGCLYCGKNRFLALFNLEQSLATRENRLNRHLIKSSCDLLAVAADKGNCGALIEQGTHICNPGFRNIKLCCQYFNDFFQFS